MADESKENKAPETGDETPAPTDTADSAETAPPDAGAEANEALDKAQHAADDIADAAASLDLPNLEKGSNAAADPTGLSMLSDVNVHVKVELGRTRMYVEDILRLNEASVIELDKAAGDPVDIYINDRHIARGEVLVVNENFCVRVSEILEQVEDLEE